MDVQTFHLVWMRKEHGLLYKKELGTAAHKAKAGEKKAKAGEKKDEGEQGGNS